MRLTTQVLLAALSSDSLFTAELLFKLGCLVSVHFYPCLGLSAPVLQFLVTSDEGSAS